MDENPLKVLSRISLVMAGVGLGIGLAALFTWEWVEVAVIPDLGAAQVEVVEGYTPLAFLLVSSLGAPLVAGLLGLFEGLRTTSIKKSLVVSVGCLIGAVVLLVIAGIFISQAGPGNGEQEGPVGFFDLISLAGLSGLASLVTGLSTSIFGSR